MSRSYKKHTKGHRHLSEKKDKVICSKMRRRTNKTILKDVEYEKDSKEFINSEEAYKISWNGQKEGCRSYQSITDARDYVKKSIKETIDSLFTERSHYAYTYQLDSDGKIISKKIRVKEKKRSWKNAKKWIFNTWNDKLLSILEISEPNDLYNVKEENIEKVAQLLYKNWHLMK